MTTGAEQESRTRTPLTRDRVLRAAADRADRNGIDAVTMRGLAEEFGVEAMSLYHHVANKDDILSGVVDVVMGEINEAVRDIALPTEPAAWKAVLRARILAARQVFLRHPWAPAVFQTRTETALSVLDYFDSVLAIMAIGGFTHQQTHHAMHALGSRALGFNQELFTPPGGYTAPAPEELQAMAQRFPHLAAMLVDAVHDDPDSTLGWCDDQAEFEFGLDLLLDGLDRLLG
ncbi:TetR/AcrR family transcriptional regulator C-terminal domain-containing protein [Catenulispora yoronensis]|uniref:TetR/AcrR family transcriptional regulator C-terminal domain-containing protein n=1 Tax=Catenulispora yoronensis TaxID=450799 RepID=A0ABP5GVY2_9ACTN